MHLPVSSVVLASAAAVTAPASDSFWNPSTTSTSGNWVSPIGVRGELSDDRRGELMVELVKVRLEFEPLTRLQNLSSE